MSKEISYLEEVAETIKSQLYLKRMEVWAWGSKDFYVLEREVDGTKHPALMFSIKTPKIQRGGRVIISLNEETDEYIVEALRISKGIAKQIGIFTGVHVGELHNVINSLIETKETYAQVFF